MRIFFLILFLLPSCIPVAKEEIKIIKKEIFIPTELSNLSFEFFRRINPLSFQEKVEYCTYIIRDKNGRLGLIKPAKGTRDKCKTPVVYDPNQAVALLHTHSSYDPFARSEIPSRNDFETIIKDGVDGFLATPGGRFWYLSLKDRASILLCGPGNCLPQDPGYNIKKDKYLGHTKILF